MTVEDWGRPELENSLGEFTRLYVQVTRGQDGRHEGAFEVSWCSHVWRRCREDWLPFLFSWPTSRVVVWRILNPGPVLLFCVAQIDNLYAALQMAVAKLKIRNSGRSVNHDRVMQAFQFIDRDKNGSLERREVLDAFNGMGIYMKSTTLDQAMKALDKDSDGHVDYSEFVKTLFPTLGQGYKTTDQ
jgi:hypothetical protein